MKPVRLLFLKMLKKLFLVVILKELLAQMVSPFCFTKKFGE
jgi:hypothetical protein